ncbi:MAG: cytochrome c oxidase assembly protein [Betaproteobacteria bacterium]|nr:cytochrome c oxidase assembly protein [Betaproteobacteria bacterium]
MSSVDLGQFRREQQGEARRTLYKLLLIVPVMLVFCASMVPLYKQICQVLGISASLATTTNTQVDASRNIRVDFDANLNRGFSWRFEPVEKFVSVHPGAVVTVNYRVTNMAPHATTGRAVPSFGPIEAGQYFQKVSCFCFSNQTLQAGETRDMPVTFYLDNKMPKDVEAIALSYTFFDVTNEKNRS